MGRKLYISQSVQHNNIGVGEYGTESDRMGLIANEAVPHLKRNGFDVRRNNGSMTLAQSVVDSNDWGAELHVACHSNAGGGSGCEVWYKSTKGKNLAWALYREIEPLSPTGDRGIKQTDNFYELNNTKCVAALVEFMYHDNWNDASYIINHMEELAVALAKGICAYFGQTYIPPAAKATEATTHLYRVQVGAYSVKANAEALAKELNAKGYQTIIKED